MKKLFVIATAVGLSFAASASTVTWGAANATVIDSSKITDGTFYLMYASTAFDASKLTGESFSASTLADAGLDKTFDSFAYSSTTFSKKNNAITPNSTGVSAGNGKTVYEVLISSDGKNLAWGQTTINLAAAAGMNQNKGLNSFTYVAASTPTPPGPVDPVTPAPEPTSGLLLLVGGAMLALRRKQK